MPDLDMYVENRPSLAVRLDDLLHCEGVALIKVAGDAIVFGDGRLAQRNKTQEAGEGWLMTKQ